MNVTNKIQCLGLEGNENVGLICTCMMEEALAGSVLVKHLRYVLFYHSAF